MYVLFASSSRAVGYWFQIFTLSSCTSLCAAPASPLVFSPYIASRSLPCPDIFASTFRGYLRACGWVGLILRNDQKSPRKGCKSLNEFSGNLKVTLVRVVTEFFFLAFAPHYFLEADFS